MDLFDGYLIEMFKAKDSKHIGVYVVRDDLLEYLRKNER